MKRVLYLIYYFKTLNRKRLHSFSRYVKAKKSISSFWSWFHMVHDSLKYNISLLEYFQFGFYEKNKGEKRKWAGTGFMYEYQRKMNPKRERAILEDKISFHNNYKAFIRRNATTLSEIKRDPQAAAKLLNNPSGKIVLKLSTGQVGNEVKIIDSTRLASSILIKKMQKHGFDLAEDFIIQHPRMDSLSPSGVNTIRIISQLDNNNQVDFLGARIRITVDSAVDNLAAGNLAAPINIETGVVSGPGIYSDITKDDEFRHPVTNTEIPGFKIPFWEEVIKLSREAALAFPENRSVGWDIAITSDGPELIEGNHNWCKLLWQLPVKQGLKPLLEKYIN